VHAVVASASLHHVADLGLALDRVATTLVPGGALAIAEWAWERFDEPTARWCFARLGPADGEPGWLHQRQQEWLASGLPWDTYRQGWAAREHCHSGQVMLRELNARFDCRACTRVPYFFHDLADTTEAAEQAAIDSGGIQATGIRCAAILRRAP
jgi:SAM-dependent methyltransferase